MSNTNVNWSSLLSDAVNQPGILSSAYSTFYNYSIGNQMMAYSQLVGRGEQLSPIATYAKWKALGRQVKKGAKAIQLCMPVTIAKKDDAGVKTGEAFQLFVLKNNWFSLSSTEGADYQHEQSTPDWSKALALSALGITEVSFDMFDGNCQGYATGKNIAVNPVAVLPHKTRFHELAHVVLGHTAENTMSDNERTPKNIKEVEAESVAYICCSVLGLDGLIESRGYIQNWLQGNEITDKSAQRIFGAADKILQAGKAKAE
jgi:antirestriction protein ArdC